MSSLIGSTSFTLISTQEGTKFNEKKKNKLKHFPFKK